MSSGRSEKLKQVLAKRQPDICVVLENVFDPHNVSAVMRSCDAVGIQEIYVLNNRIPRHKKWGFKSSSSAFKWLTIHQFSKLDECLAAIRLKYEKVYATHLDHQAISLYEMDLTGSMALVFGNEHSGCSEEIIAKADGNFIIPQVGVIQSLNISVACAVSIYEAFRQKQLAGHYQHNRLPSKQVFGLLKDWSMWDDWSEWNKKEGFRP